MSLVNCSIFKVFWVKFSGYSVVLLHKHYIPGIFIHVQRCFFPALLRLEFCPCLFYKILKIFLKKAWYKGTINKISMGVEAVSEWGISWVYTTCERVIYGKCLWMWNCWLYTTCQQVVYWNICILQKGKKLMHMTQCKRAGCWYAE